MIRTLVSLLIVLALFFSVPYVSNLWVGNQLQKELDLEFEGKVKPKMFVAAFDVVDPKITWNERISLSRGKLSVDYQLLDLLTGLPLRLQFSGENVGVKLLGDWAQMQGVEDAVLDKLFVDVAVGRSGLEEVYSVFVKSPKLNFEMKETV